MSESDAHESDARPCSTQVSAGGRKSRILMSMNVASELRDQLDTFDQFLQTLGKTSSATMRREERTVVNCLERFRRTQSKQPADQRGRLSSFSNDHARRSQVLSRLERERTRSILARTYALHTAVARCHRARLRSPRFRWLASTLLARKLHYLRKACPNYGIH